MLAWPWLEATQPEAPQATSAVAPSFPYQAVNPKLPPPWRNARDEAYVCTYSYTTRSPYVNFLWGNTDSCQHSKLAYDQLFRRMWLAFLAREKEEVKVRDGWQVWEPRYGCKVRGVHAGITLNPFGHRSLNHFACDSQPCDWQRLALAWGITQISSLTWLLHPKP